MTINRVNKALTHILAFSGDSQLMLKRMYIITTLGSNCVIKFILWIIKMIVMKTTTMMRIMLVVIIK